MQIQRLTKQDASVGRSGIQWPICLHRYACNSSYCSGDVLQEVCIALGQDQFSVVILTDSQCSATGLYHMNHCVCSLCR